MYRRVVCSVGVMVVVCALNWHTVSGQCTTKQCVNDDGESGIGKMFSHIQDTLDSLKEELNREVGSLRDEIRSLKEQLPGKSTGTTTRSPDPPAYDCEDLLNQGYRKSGEYNIHLQGRAEQIRVYCDMDTDGGGWLVFQRRINGYVTFTREWEPYKKGFGNISGEFWLGNDNLHYITSNKNYSLRIDMGGGEGGSKYAVYSKFAVKSEDRWYRLTLGSYTGTAGDAFSYHNGRYFTTLDKDNDSKSGDNCANAFKGGWWYGYCAWTVLNGMYNRSYSWRGYTGLETDEMKIRPLSGP